MNKVDFIYCNGHEIAYIIDDGIVWMRADDVGYYLGYSKNNYGHCQSVYAETGIGNVTSAKWKYFEHIKKEQKAYRKSSLDELKIKSKKSASIVSRKVIDLKLAIQDVELSPVEDANDIVVNKSRITPGKRIYDKAVLSRVEPYSPGRVKMIFENGTIRVRKIEQYTCVRAVECCMSGRNFQKGDSCTRIIVRVAGFGTYYIDNSLVQAECAPLQLPLDDMQYNPAKEKDGWFKSVSKWLSGLFG